MLLRSAMHRSVGDSRRVRTLLYGMSHGNLDSMLFKGGCGRLPPVAIVYNPVALQVGLC